MSDFNSGRINKTDFRNRLQDAVAKAAAVGVGVHVVYLLATTPSGWIVVGAAVVSYVVADAVITQIRSELEGEHITAADLKGIVPNSFLDNLNPNLEAISRSLE